MQEKKTPTTKKYDLSQIQEILFKNKNIRNVIYLGVGVITLYLLGRTFKILASSVRGFNELKSAIKGD